MPRTTRTDVGEYVYHVLNRANARVQIFDNDKDYRIFEGILEKAVKKFDMRLLAYCIMPNHWHLALYPKHDGDLARFTGWLTNTHTRKWHVEKDTIGQGHLYQGRYRSFLCQNDDHFISLVRYIERNAKRAGLAQRAEDWRWSSAWREVNGTAKQKELLSTWPLPRPEDYLNWLNQREAGDEEEAIKMSIIKSNPYGGESWVSSMVERFRLNQTLRRVGRPKTKNGG